MLRTPCSPGALSWQDENNNVEGVINGERAVEALEAYKELTDCCQPPGMAAAFFTETNDAFISGQSVMAMNFFAFFPALANPDVNPYAEALASSPTRLALTGTAARRWAARASPSSTTSATSAKQASLDFIKWFAQEDVQLEWAALGGYTCNANVLESDTFLNATPFNPAFAETMTIVKDFWNVPVYDPLLQAANREFGGYVVEGQGTAQEAMDRIAAEHTTILKEAGLLE